MSLSLLLQQSHEGTSVPGINYQVTSSAAIPNTRSTITSEDRGDVTPHNAIKANTTTKIFVAICLGACILFCIFLATAYKRGFSHLCCLSRAGKREEPQRAKREKQDRDRGAHRLDEFVSYTQRDEVVNQCRNERLGVRRQGQLGTRETGSGGVADVGDEELPERYSKLTASFRGSEQEGIDFE
jgi:hypothetical protein